MDQGIKEIAARLHDLREIAGKTAAETARALGVTQTEYEFYERGLTDMPVSFLTRAAALFGVELSILLTGEAPRLHIWEVVRAGKGVGVDRRREYRYQNLAHNFANKRAEPFMVTVDPPAAGDEVQLHAHPGQEFDHVIEGSMKVTIDDREIILGPGDSLYFDSSHPHAMRAHGGRAARFLAVIL